MIQGSRVDVLAQGLDYQAFQTPSTPKKQGGYQDGLSNWTVEQDKEYDPRLFRNRGHSYWETTQLPYVPPVSKAKVEKSPGGSGVGHSFIALLQSQARQRTTGIHQAIF
jgi:hypothetical protein